MELQLFVHKERKNMFLAWQILARQRGTVMAFIPDHKQGLFSLEVSIASRYMPFGLIKPCNDSHSKYAASVLTCCV